MTISQREALKKKIKLGLLAWTSQHLKTSLEMPLKIMIYTYYAFIHIIKNNPVL